MYVVKIKDSTQSFLMYVLKQVGSKGFALRKCRLEVQICLHTPSRKNNSYTKAQAQIQVYTYKHIYLHIKNKRLPQCPDKRLPNCPNQYFQKEQIWALSLATSSVLLCQQLLQLSGLCLQTKFPTSGLCPKTLQVKNIPEYKMKLAFQLFCLSFQVINFYLIVHILLILGHSFNC